MNEYQVIVVFTSTHAAITAESAAKKIGIPVRMGPVPRRISSDCNVGMFASPEHEEAIKSVLENEGIEFRIEKY